MRKTFVLIALMLAIAGGAIAQVTRGPINQQGAVTPGNIAVFVGNNVVKDGGAPGSSFGNVTTQRVLGRNTAGSGPVEEVTASQELDWIGSTRGSVLYRGAAGWAILTPGTSGDVLTSNGAGADPSYKAAGGGSSTIVNPQGRLTLTTGTPVMTASATAQTTVYYTPSNAGNYIPLYNGSTWTMTAFTEVSQATTDSTKSPAAATTNSNYDVFCWDNSGTFRCTRGPAWTSDTARGTGAGTTELVRVDGRYLNAVSITNGPAASRGTYVGTIRTNGSSQVDMIFGGAGAAGGENTILGVWNAYNRVNTALKNFDDTNSWQYTTATYRIKNGNNANKISFVVGLREDGIRAVNNQVNNNNTVLVTRIVQIALDSTTTATAGSSTSANNDPVTNGAGLILNYTAQFLDRAPLGFHYLAPLEFSAATGTTNWYGDNGGTNQLSLFFAEIMASNDNDELRAVA